MNKYSKWVPILILVLLVSLLPATPRHSNGHTRQPHQKPWGWPTPVQWRGADYHPSLDWVLKKASTAFI